MPRTLALVFLVAVSLHAAPRRRAVMHPSNPRIDRETVTALAIKVAHRVEIPAFEPRLHWENVPYLDGVLLVAEQMPAGAERDALIERVAAVILGSGDDIGNIHWGDGTAFAQVVMDLYRLTPAGDPRREALLGLLPGSMAFAEHAIRVSQQTGNPRSPWWVEGGYGARYWQDDLYMVVPWLAMAGSTKDGLPANAHARDLAYDWIEAYVYDHRDGAVATSRDRKGWLLWDEQQRLFQHAPEDIGSDHFWGRGNGWALMALSRAAKYLDTPYGGSQYAGTLDSAAIRAMLVRAAESIVARQAPGGGWTTNLSQPAACPVVETSATGFLTAFLARGVNEGWLDRETYTPVVLRAFSLLMDRVDREGNVRGIQPPGVGPITCGEPLLATNQQAINVNYGAGAVLLAAAEILRLIDSAATAPTLQELPAPRSSPVGGNA
jgi:rhamnogalacturonyl hydrolase YesR